MILLIDIRNLKDGNNALISRLYRLKFAEEVKMICNDMHESQQGRIHHQ